jgi:cell division protein FtsZ
MPFEVEHVRRENARKAVSALSETCDSVVLLDNTKLRKTAGKLPLRTAFAVANGLIGEFIRSITETITTPSLLNLDFADLKAVLENGGISSFGIGEAEGIERAEKAVERAIAAPLLDIPDLSSSHGLLISITGGGDMTLDEVTKVGEIMVQHVPKARQVIWGARVEENMIGRLRVIALFSGVSNPFQ